jgi:peptide-methionine (S)-S-oxide reductase
VGYTGGSLPDPTYEHLGDHTEALQIDFDPRRISYEELMKRFWEEHDPSARPYSRQYMAAVFYANTTQWAQALETGKQRLAGKTVTLRTPMMPLTPFYRAEDYHQKYYLRRYSNLMSEFDGYSEQTFTDSTVAAKLNGYVGGYRPVEQLAPELEQLGLSEPGRKHLLSLVTETLARRRY